MGFLRELKKEIAIRKANRLHKLTGYKYCVFKKSGGFKTYRVTDLKKLNKLHFFRKGMSIRDILKKAVYITM